MARVNKGKLRTIIREASTTKEVERALKDHWRWLIKKGGSQANLSGMDLTGYTFRGYGRGRESVNPQLAKLDLSGAVLRGATMVRANLGYSNLSGADLSKADLSSSKVNGANFSGADLSGAILRNARSPYTGANFENANLSGANLSGAVFHGFTTGYNDGFGTSFKNANLIGANLDGADLTGADLRGARIDKGIYGATISGAQFDSSALELLKGHPDWDELTRISDDRIWPNRFWSGMPPRIGNMKPSQMRNSQIDRTIGESTIKDKLRRIIREEVEEVDQSRPSPSGKISQKELDEMLLSNWRQNLRRGNRRRTYLELSGMDLSGLTFRGFGRGKSSRYADLTGAELNGTNLSGAIMANATLSFANLKGANLSGADLSGCDLGGANFTNANLSNAILVDTKNYYPVTFVNADLSGADLSNARLGSSRLQGANLQGAILDGAYLQRSNFKGAKFGENFYRASVLGSVVDRAGLRMLKKHPEYSDSGMLPPLPLGEACIRNAIREEVNRINRSKRQLNESTIVQVAQDPDEISFVARELERAGLGHVADDTFSKYGEQWAHVSSREEAINVLRVLWGDDLYEEDYGMYIEEL